MGLLKAGPRSRLLVVGLNVAVLSIAVTFPFWGHKLQDLGRPAFLQADGLVGRQKGVRVQRRRWHENNG